jgi:hypothetical protein
VAKRSSVHVLAATPCDSPNDGNESCSVNVRKIDNGYIVSESRCKGSEYSHSEKFSKTKPDLDAATRRETNAGREGLRDAMKELRRK